MGVRDEIARNGAPHARKGLPLYSKPEERRRATGSDTETGSRRKSQRATANPNAAYHQYTNLIIYLRPYTSGLVEELCGFHTSNPALRYQRPDRAIDVARKWG
jgi:hypothetical protein